MNTKSDTQRSLEVFRYAIVLMAFNAFLVCLMSPIALTSNPNINGNLSFDDTFVPALFVSGATTLVCTVAYFAYAYLLQRVIGKRKQSLSIS